MKIFTNFKRILQLALATYLLLPVQLFSPVFADEAPASSVQNPEPTTLADGTVLKKTVEPVAGMINKWKVTLRVEAKKTTKKSDIVLVVDTSGSMKDNNRMTEAKKAAKNFVNQLLNAEHPNTRIALATFETKTYLKQDFTNYTGKQNLLNAIDSLQAEGGTFTQGGIRVASYSLSNSQADFKNMVLLSDGVPTFNYAIKNPDNYLVEGGPGGHPFQKETRSDIPKSAFNYIVPDPDHPTGSGNSMWKRYWSGMENGHYYHHYYNSGNCAIAEASFAKQAGVKIHTVAVNATPQGDGVLKNIATSPDDAYKTEDPAQLNTIFNKIATKIESAVQNAIVTDLMGNGVVAVNSDANTTLSDGGKKLVWHLGTPTQQEGDKFIAETSYEIELDQNILNATADANGFYPANASATITYNKNQTGTFPVPKINPTFIKLTKQLEGQTCADCKFKIALKRSGSIQEEHSLSAAETKTLYHSMKVGTYEVEETGTSDNPIDLNKYTITYTPQQFTLTQGGDDQAVTIKNVYETTNVYVRKQWEGKLGDSATINLLSNGSKIGEVKLNEANNWDHTFTNLPKNEGGQEIVYTVTENFIENYETAITKNSKNNFTVTNTYVSPKINITATKKWDGGPAWHPLVTIELWRNNTKYDSQIIAGGIYDEKSVSWEVDKNDKWGNPYTYDVKESLLPDFSPNYNNSTASDGSLTVSILNKQDFNLEITVSKVWSDNNNQDGKRKPSTIRLLADGKEVDSKPITTENATYTFSKLPKCNYVQPTGICQEINYTVEEDEIAGYTSTISGDPTQGFTITNTHTPELINLPVRKVWVDGDNQDGLRPNNVQVELFANGVTTGAILDITKTSHTSICDAWCSEFSNRPKYQDGTEILYSLKEISVPDYTSTITGNSNQGFTITNTHTPATVKINVHKRWDDQNNIDQLRSLNTSINICAVGTTSDGSYHNATCKTILTGLNNDSIINFTDLPKFHAGQLIAYTVEERNILNGYIARLSTAELEFVRDIAEVQITNIHIPKVPQTGFHTTDNSANSTETITLASIISSSILFLTIFFIFNRKQAKSNSK